MATIHSIIICLTLLHCCIITNASIRTTGREITEQGDNDNHRILTTPNTDETKFDIFTCSADVTLHDSRLGKGIANSERAVQDGKEFFQEYLTDDLTRTARYGALKGLLANGMDHNPRQSLITVPSNGKFTFWGQQTYHNRPGKENELHLQMSLFQGDIIDGKLIEPNNVAIKSVEHGVKMWDVIYPEEDKLKIASQKIKTLPKGPKEYIVFISIWHSVYQHMLTDHIGYLSYIKDAFPNANIILPGNRLQDLMKVIDPIFESTRITYLPCGVFEGCSDRIFQAPDGIPLSIFLPPVSSKSVELSVKARQWLWSSSFLQQQQQQQQQRTIIYCKRTMDVKARMRRIMNSNQEEVIIEMIQHAMKRFNRLEQFVIFDGSNTDIEYQLNLFSSATIVIGPHGGAMSNLLYTPLVNNCNDRTKLIEFVQSSETPLVQSGGYDKTYYRFFSTIPWIELHQIYFIPPSNRTETFVDVESFHDALTAVMSNNDLNSGEYAVSLTPNFGKITEQ